MNKRVKEILERLADKYGKNIAATLDYEKPYELLFATILSAQCTDERVNMVTKNLYKKYNVKREY